MQGQRLLVTRPEPGASATAAKLAAMGHSPTLLPCLSISALAPKWPPNPVALVITSGQAVPVLPQELHHLPVFCVGDATAAKLRMAGFHRVESASGDAKALAKLVAVRNLPGLHLLAVGQGHGKALAGTLRKAGLNVLRRSVYKAEPLASLPTDMRASLAAGQFDGALFYSAETARAFSALRPSGTAMMQAFALSPKVANALKGLPWAAIHVAIAPTEADLMAFLA